MINTSACTPAVPAAPAKKKRTGKAQKNLYEQYLADSGSDVSSADSEVEEWDVLARQEYTTNMDINILIQQTVRNIVQSLCLEDYDGTSRFGDHELICFAAAVKHNSSIVSLQIRYLDVSDVSLVPLCRALENHPSLRALDLSGTRGGDETGRALRNLVCTNPHIIFAQIDDTIVSGKDAQLIEEATRYNALACPDPQTNPFHLGLLRKISAIEERESKFIEELEAKPWLQSSAVVEPDPQPQKTKKNKKVTIRATGGSKLGAEVCAQFVQGSCAYGSRCKYFHPERTAALRNAVTSSRYEAAESGAGGDGQSIAFSSATSASGSRLRLRSRLRPAQFTLQPSDTIHGAAPASQRATITQSPQRPTKSAIAGVWILSVTIVMCCATMAACL